jgi:hypothetical protein
MKRMKAIRSVIVFTLKDFKMPADGNEIANVFKLNIKS